MIVFRKCNRLECIAFSNNFANTKNMEIVRKLPRRQDLAFLQTGITRASFNASGNTACSNEESALNRGYVISRRKYHRISIAAFRELSSHSQKCFSKFLCFLCCSSSLYLLVATGCLVDLFLINAAWSCIVSPKYSSS